MGAELGEPGVLWAVGVPDGIVGIEDECAGEAAEFSEPGGAHEALLEDDEVVGGEGVPGGKFFRGDEGEGGACGGEGWDELAEAEVGGGEGGLAGGEG